MWADGRRLSQIRLRVAQRFLEGEHHLLVGIDEVDRLGFGVFEEVEEEKLGLAPAGAEVEVRDPDRTIFGDRGKVDATQ